MWGWLLASALTGGGVTLLLTWWHRRRSAVQAALQQDRTREAEQLAFAAALASGLAHEVRNPLSTLRLNLQLLEEDLKGPQVVPTSRFRTRVEVLHREVERLNDVLNDYLRFARERHLDREPANLNDVLDELLEFLRPEALRRHVELRHQFAPDPPRSLLDVNLLKQAFLNLIINAFEAMPQGGDLIVQTDADGRSLTARITDTGTGIPAEELDKVFRVYYSTKPGGTGLGLPTARRIIQEHGGSLTLTSEVGRGTQALVTLPIVSDAPEPSASSSDPRTEAVAKTEGSRDPALRAGRARPRRGSPPARRGRTPKASEGAPAEGGSGEGSREGSPASGPSAY